VRSLKYNLPGSLKSFQWINLINNDCPCDALNALWVTFVGAKAYLSLECLAVKQKELASVSVNGDGNFFSF